MGYNIDIEKLLKLAYRVTPNRYTVPEPVEKKSVNDYSINDTVAVKPNNNYKVEVLQKNESDIYSILGQPVLSPLVVQPFDYNQYNESEFTLQSFSGYRFPDATIVTVQMKKHIVKTRVQGRAGTVKEMISDGDYEIKVQGVILDTDNFTYPAQSNSKQITTSKYPAQQVQAMNELMRIPASLPIQNDFLNQLGIYHLVVESFEFPAASNFENAQLFTISTLSDADFDVQGVDEPFNPNL